MAEELIEERVIGLDLDTTGALPWRLYTQTDGHSRAGWWCYEALGTLLLET